MIRPEDRKSTLPKGQSSKGFMTLIDFQELHCRIAVQSYAVSIASWCCGFNTMLHSIAVLSFMAVNACNDSTIKLYLHSFSCR